MGQIVGGLLALSGGVTGEILGGIASVTGIGALLGVPVAVVSTGLVIGGLANLGAGIRGLTQAWMEGGRGPRAGSAATENEKSPGLKHTKHSRERAIQRGFSDEAIDSIVHNNAKTRVGKVDEFGRKTWEYSDLRGNTVVTNDSGEVVTVFSKARGGRYIAKAQQ